LILESYKDLNIEENATINTDQGAVYFSYEYVELAKNNKFNRIRGLQIGSWLDEYNTTSKDKIEKYLIIDDEIVDIKPYLPKENILKINSKDGLTEEKITERIKVSILSFSLFNDIGIYQEMSRFSH